MKKSLLSLVAFVFGISAFAGIANWLSISDIFSNGEPSVNTAYTQLLNEYSSDWWYLDGVSLTCEVDGNNVTIVSPRIGDSIDETAPAYRLFISPYRVSQIKNGEPTVDNSKIKMIEQKVDTNVSEINFKLSTSDVSDSQSYYGFITPLDMYDVIWTPSKEICFQIDKNVCMLDTDCDTFDLVVNPTKTEPEPEDNPTPDEPGSEVNPEPEANPEDGHGSADCVSMEYANVRHTSDGKNITLTWTDVGGGDVDIAIYNPDDEVFEKLATVKMSDERYVYKMRWNGVQNFILTNECWQSKYKADEGITEWEPEKIVTPATGPAENIMYIAIAAIILYGAYAVFFRKSDN